MKTRIAVSVVAPAMALALSLASTSARADLTYQGAVGLPLNPTAQIPAEGGIRLQGNYYDFGDASTATTSADSKLYGLYAAGRVAGKVEISGGVQQVRNRVRVVGTSSSDNETGFTLGAKYLFTRESDPAGVRLAAGVGFGNLDVFSSDTKNYHAYLVGSKYLGAVTGERVPITGHLGLRFDRFTFSSGAANDRENKVSVYGGVEVPITPRADVSFVGELQSKNIDGGGTPYSASIRYRPQNQPFGASIGIQRQGLGDSGLFVQLGYTFGGNAAQEATEAVPGQ